MELKIFEEDLVRISDLLICFIPQIESGLIIFPNTSQSALFGLPISYVTILVESAQTYKQDYKNYTLQYIKYLTL